MFEVKVLAPAKVNLFLEITGHAPGGYHTLDTVMQAVALCDIVTVTETPQPGIQLTCDWPDVPLDGRNLAVRAAEQFFSRTSCTPASGFAIHLEKHIPMQAGLGGGSADAAAVLVALNALCDTALPPVTLREIGAQLGADVPFMLHGGCVRAGGIGEQLLARPALWPETCRFLIAKPAHAISTAKAYARYDAMHRESPLASPQMLLDALADANFAGIARALFNVFEQTCGWPGMYALKAAMLEHGACGALLTGSGSAVFGLFADAETAQACAQRLDGLAEHCAVVPPCPHGAKLLP